MRTLVLLVLALFAGAAGAQSYPTKPVHWVLPFAPGGPTDLVSRVITPKLSERLGQPVVIENRSGAAGNIAADYVARAPADGHTLLYVVPSLVTNLFLIKNSPDPREFAPIVLVTRIPMALLTSNAFGADSVADVVARVKAKPGTVSCAAPGSLSTVGCELLRAHARADVLIVNYRGSAPSLNATMSGEVNLFFDLANNALPQVRTGRVRAIASTSAVRGAGPFTDLPTVAETIPGFELVSWQGVVAPRATPREVIQRLNREIGAVLADADVRKRLLDTGVEVAGGDVAAFEQVMKNDYEKYGSALRNAGIRPQ